MAGIYKPQQEKDTMLCVCVCVCVCVQNQINFIEYVEALRHVATTMRVSLNEIMERVVLIHTPLPVD